MAPNQSMGNDFGPNFQRPDLNDEVYGDDKK
jgi:hypothetical protein